MEGSSHPAVRRDIRFKALVALVLFAGAVLAPERPVSASSGQIGGVAFDDLDRDGWRDPGEPAFGGHSIYLLTAGATAFIAQAVTDAEGRYSFGTLDPGTYRVAYNSTTWNPMRDDWFPTTAPIGSPPWVEVAVDGPVAVDWGFRRIVRSTDPAQPVSEYVGPSGLRVQSYVDVVEAAAIHDVLASGLLGPEAARTTVRFGLSSSSTTTTSSVQADGRYVGYSAMSYATYLSWAAGGGSWTTVAHEYGHAWSWYHATMTQQTGSFDAYLAARGLAGDTRVGSSYAWAPEEMIAEDYRQLLGPLPARSAPQVNQQIPAAAQVSGLREFLEHEFTTAPAGTADTTAPAVQVLGPPSGSTLAGAVSVVASATDDRTDVSSLAVEVLVDGFPRATAAFDPADGRFHATLDTTTLADGAHVLVARAADAAGNAGTSAAVSVTVQNAKRKGGGSKPSTRSR